MRTRHRRLGGLVLSAALLVTGCGSPPPSPPPANLVPVQGRVTFDGTPVAGADLQFAPITNNLHEALVAAATTDANGGFVLKSHPHGEGALPGIYTVTIRFYPGVPTKVPEKYGDPSTTPLKKVEIPAGGKKDLVLNLSE
jgi:hypothetical protein